MKHLNTKTATCYLTGLALLFFLKLFYSRAASNDLLWILAPTAWWVRILGGIPFCYRPQVGYVNHTLQFVLAPSCSGVQFLMAALAVLIFSYAHEMRTLKKGVAWIAISMAAAYPFTIMANAIRIILAIRLPKVLTAMGGGDLPAKQIHTIIGIAVYFPALLLLYQIFSPIARRFSATISCESDSTSSNTPKSQIPPESVKKSSLLLPLFWYLFVVLGLPFLNRAYERENAFIPYAILVTVLCGIITGTLFAAKALWKWLVLPPARHKSE